MGRHQFDAIADAGNAKYSRTSAPGSPIVVRRCWSSTRDSVPTAKTSRD
jgi:hypothetical protein